MSATESATVIINGVLQSQSGGQGEYAARPVSGQGAVPGHRSGLLRATVATQSTCHIFESASDPGMPPPIVAPWTAPGAPPVRCSSKTATWIDTPPIGRHQDQPGLRGAALWNQRPTTSCTRTGAGTGPGTCSVARNAIHCPAAAQDLPRLLAQSDAEHASCLPGQAVSGHSARWHYEQPIQYAGGSLRIALITRSLELGGGGGGPGSTTFQTLRSCCGCPGSATEEAGFASTHLAAPSRSAKSCPVPSADPSSFRGIVLSEQLQRFHSFMLGFDLCKNKFRPAPISTSADGIF